MVKTSIQKVEVVNLPKDIIGKIGIILSLIVAIISLTLYIGELNKKPNLSLDIFSPSPYLGKAIFDFNDIEYSKPLEFHISLYNHGEKLSQGPSLNIIFSKNVNVSLENNTEWKENQNFVSSGYKVFSFEDRDIVIFPDTIKSIGNFKLSIPKQKESILLAMFIIRGDVGTKSGLIYYHYDEQQYSIKQDIDNTDVVNIWNENVNIWNR